MDDDDRAVVGFAMLAHAAFHAYELSIPVFIVAWLDVFGSSEATLGLVATAGYAMIGIGAVPSGLIADARGAKLPVACSLFGMGAGFLLLSVAPNVPVVALALLLWGSAASLYHPAGLSLLSRGTTERGSAFAYHGAAGNVGTVVGPLAATALISVGGWRSAAAAFVVPAVAGGLLAWRVDLPGDRSDADVGGSAADRDAGSSGRTSADVRAFIAESRRLFSGAFVVVFGVAMLYGLYYRGVVTFLPEVLGGLAALEPVTALGRTVRPARYAYAGLLLVGVVGQYAGGKLTDVIETDRALAVSFAGLLATALAFLPASRAGVAPLVAVCVALGFFVYFAAPVYQAAIADAVTSDSHGLSYGYTYTGTFGVGALGAAAAGAALTYAGRTTLFSMLAALAAASLALTVVFARRNDGRR